MPEKIEIVKTVIRIEILSDGHIPDDWTLETIGHEIVHGDMSGRWDVTEERVLSKEEVIEECIKHATDPEFFGIEEEEDEEK